MQLHHEQRMLDTRITQRVIEEVEDTIDWLNLFALEAGLPDALIDELRARLEHIERLAARL